MVKHLKQKSFHEKLCNLYFVKSNVLYFQDKISICRFINYFKTQIILCTTLKKGILISYGFLVTTNILWLFNIKKIYRDNYGRGWERARLWNPTYNLGQTRRRSPTWRNLGRYGQLWWVKHWGKMILELWWDLGVEKRCS